MEQNLKDFDLEQELVNLKLSNREMEAELGFKKETIDKCQYCGEDVNPEDRFCKKCGLVFDNFPIYDNSGFDTFNAPLGNGVELESKLTHFERKYGWNSPSANRYNKFKERYYNIFEEELLKYGFSLVEIDIIFLNDFTGWYKRNSKKIGGMKRKDVVNRFLEFNML